MRLKSVLVPDALDGAKRDADNLGGGAKPSYVEPVPAWNLKTIVTLGAAIFAAVSALLWLWSAAVRVPAFRMKDGDGSILSTDGDAAWDALDGLRLGARISAFAAASAAVAAGLQATSLLIN